MLCDAAEAPRLLVPQLLPLLAHHTRAPRLRVLTQPAPQLDLHMLRSRMQEAYWYYCGFAQAKAGCDYMPMVAEVPRRRTLLLPRAPPAGYGVLAIYGSRTVAVTVARRSGPLLRRRAAFSRNSSVQPLQAAAAAAMCAPARPGGALSLAAAAVARPTAVTAQPVAAMQFIVDAAMLPQLQLQFEACMAVLGESFPTLATGLAVAASASEVLIEGNGGGQQVYTHCLV
jgi:hypothetical protein